MIQFNYIIFQISSGNCKDASTTTTTTLLIITLTIIKVGLRADC